MFCRCVAEPFIDSNQTGSFRLLERLPIWQGFKTSKPSKLEVASKFIQEMRAAAI